MPAPCNSVACAVLLANSVGVMGRHLGAANPHGPKACCWVIWFDGIKQSSPKDGLGYPAEMTRNLSHSLKKCMNCS